ncbi:MAG: helix-turn-helix domain-containing protein [Treponema sp.]|jgi:AraC family transcriptional regulator|nr:helix-turn-helix domain-containing protein [Treponema sp.]
MKKKTTLYMSEAVANAVKIQEPHDLMENVLNQIENTIKDDISIDFLAENLRVSRGHLQRLFKFTFKQPLGAYIRSRKLSASLENISDTSFKIIDIAMEYGFGYEQSYIRSFRREFGVTPGIIRRTGQKVKTTPPLNLHDTKCS